MKYQLIAGILLAITLCILFGCATPPKFEDGTRASYVPIPCNADSCGKLPDGF